jgi:rare lipoprotein A (peptidoglycan hydrolase)
MHRWLVILSLVVAQYPGFAAASTKSPEVPLWKRLLSALTTGPAAKPIHHDQTRRSRVVDQARPSKPAAAPNSPEPPPTPPIRGAGTGSTGSDAGCTSGRRVVSAYYWQGQHTASGQPFDPNGLTAAHRTLPFGTRLTVTNPRTGQSVIVVVNDRGPFVPGVSLDLSLGAAQAIGMRGVGAVCIL